MSISEALASSATTAGETYQSTVSTSVTLFFTLVLIAMIVTLALEEKIHAKKSLIVAVYAVLCLIIASELGLMPFGDITLPGGHKVKMPVYIPAVDWGVITIILGSSIFVDVTARSGLFTWIAIKLTKASSGDPLILLWYYGLMTVVFSAVLNNVTAMIIVGSLTGVSLKKLNQQDKLLGFLLIAGMLTNIGGMLTLVSSVPNIIVGNTAGISFMEFFLKSSPFVVIATVLTVTIGARLFGIRRLNNASDLIRAKELVAGFDENDGIESENFFRFAAVMLIAFIATIATTSAIPVIRDLGIGFVALSFAVIMLTRYKAEVDHFYKAIDWDLVIFFLSLFVVINVLEHAQVLALIGQGVAFMIGDGENIIGTASLLISSAIFSSVTDNIPLAAMLSKILASAGTPADSSLWWSVVFGANLGGNFTPIGSASTLVAVALIHKYQIPLSFGQFVRKALPYAIIQIALATLYVLIVL